MLKKFLSPYRKIVFFVLAFFMLAGIFVPTTALAVRRIVIIAPERIPVSRPPGIPGTWIDPTGLDMQDPPNLVDLAIDGQDFVSNDEVWYRMATNRAGTSWRNWAKITSRSAFGFTKTYMGPTQIAVRMDPGTAIYGGTPEIITNGWVQFVVCRNNIALTNQNPTDNDPLVANCSNVKKIIVVDSASFAGIFTAVSAGITEISRIFDEILSKFSLSWDEFWTQMLVEITNFFSRLCYYIAVFCSDVFRFILNELIQDPNNKWAITRGDPTSMGGIFLVAWNEVKMYANMIIVLLFVAIATMMILRYKPEEAQHLIWPTLFTALFINFSVVFIGLMIDGSNILTRYLLVGADQQMSLVYRIDYAYNNIVRPLRFPLDFMGAVRYFFMSLPINFMHIALAISFMYFALMVIQRYFILAMLFIVAPLAFVFRVVPNGKANEVWSKWWSSFLKYLFVLVPAAFFLNLSVKVLVALPAASWVVTRGNEWQDLVKILFNFTVVLFIFLFGMKIAFKSAGPVVNAVMAATAAITAAIITGGASLMMTGAGATAKMAGAGKAVDAVGGLKDSFKQGMVGLGESVGYYAKGTQARMQKEDLAKRYEVDKETKEHTKTLSNDDLLATSRQYGNTSDKVRQKIAAIQELAERNMLKDLDPAEQLELTQYAADSGVKSSEMVAKMSGEGQAQVIRGQQFGGKAQEEALKGLANKGQLDRVGDADFDRVMTQAMNGGADMKEVISALDGPTMARIIRDGVFNPQTRAKVFKAMADKKQLDLLTMGEQIDALNEATIEGVKPEDIVGKMSSDIQAHIIETNLFNPETQAKAVESLARKNKLDAIDEPHRDRAYRAAVANGVDAEDLESKDYRAGAYNEARLKSLGATDADIQTVRGGGTIAQQTAARNEVLDENISSMRGDQLRDIDPADLTGPNGYERVLKLNPKQVLEFSSSPALIPVVQAHVADITNEIDNAQRGFPAGTTVAAKLGPPPMVPNPTIIDDTERKRLVRLLAAINSL